MPPKKKGKKGKKGGKGTKAKPESAAPRPPKMSDSSKEYYLVQVRDLEKRILRMQKRCDELAMMNEQISGEFSHLSIDKREICEYLKESLHQKGDEINSLSYDLSQLQEARDAEKENYENQLEQLKTSLLETREQLTSENMILSGKLSSMEEFKIQKEELMSKFAAMEQEIAKIESEYKDILYHKERNAVVDKDRLRKEMLRRVDGLAAEFRKVSNRQMAETTKRTIVENVDLNGELHRMSDRTMKLVAENDQLKLQERELRQQVDILADIERELYKKNQGNTKVIGYLVEECKEIAARLEEYESPELEENHYTTREQHEAALKEVEQLKNEDNRLRKEALEYNRLIRKTVEDLKESKRFLRKINRLIADTRISVLDAQGLLGEDDDELTEAEIIQKRQKMLQSFLVMLNSASTLHVGIHPSDIGAQSVVKEYRPPSPPSPREVREADLGEDIAKTVGEFHREPISQEKLAQFGLSPVPSTSSQHPQTRHFSSELLRSLSATTRLGRVSRVPMRSTGVQAGSEKSLLRTERLVDQGVLPVLKETSAEMSRDRSRRAGAGIGLSSVR